MKTMVSWLESGALVAALVCALALGACGEAAPEGAGGTGGSPGAGGGAGEGGHGGDGGEGGAGGEGGTGGSGGVGGSGGSGGGARCASHDDCAPAADACWVAFCNDGSVEGEVGRCVEVPATEGTSCDDGRFCTEADVCQAGLCVGTEVPDCGSHFEDPVDACPGAWTLQGDWACGTPTNVGPPGCHSGSRCFGTVLDGDHSADMSYASNFLRSPTITVPSTSVDPVLTFWGWVDTMASNYAAFAVFARREHEASLTRLLDVDPPHTHASSVKESWGGDRSQFGWERYTVDLGDYVGDDIVLEFQMYASGSTNFIVRPGVYLDDFQILDRAAVEPVILETPFHDAFEQTPWSKRLVGRGGLHELQWSIVGGSNHGWLAIEPEGRLSGTPDPAEVGPVTVTVRAQALSDPSLSDERTLAFEVRPGSPYYATGFEGACPDGWTLAGDWQCGVPLPPAAGDHPRPEAAHGGSQCLGTQLAGHHSNNQSWVVARSPAISLAGATNPVAYFRMWSNTWGLGTSGMNLRVAADGGAAQLHSAVSPPYTIILPTPLQLGWGGDQSGAGWRLVRADLGAYAGQSVELELAFRSTNILARPGVYVDDVIVMEE